jgi:LAO/AO transport system kinase
MYGHSLDLGVYIRSMGARGHLGGLSLATREAVRLVGAFGFETVILETVGVGQSELEVASLADTTIVVVNPEQGDEVQMLKAGILEIADIFVVNKSDLSGAKKTRQQIRQTLHLGVRRDWTPPIINTVATRSEGVEELMTATNQHREFLSQSGVGELRRQDQLRHEVADLAAERGRELTLRRLDRDVELHQRLMTDQLPDEIVDEVLGRRPS